MLRSPETHQSRAPFSTAALVVSRDPQIIELVEVAGARLQTPVLQTDSHDALCRTKAGHEILARVIQLEHAEQLSLLNDQHAGRPPILMISAAAADVTIAALRSGAWDCLAPPVDADALTSTLGAAIDEGRRRFALRLRVDSFDRRLELLTDKERSVLDAVCDGKLNKQIASEMAVSIRTIEERRRRVYEKMEVPSATQLARQVAEVQLIHEFWQARFQQPR